MASNVEDNLNKILEQYRNSFADKVYNSENDDHDLLMRVFGITPEVKRENRQYWGRELGMCWQLLIDNLCKEHCKDYGPALRYGADEPCDLTVGKLAIDTKYRIGSGDSGTLKKFKAYGPMLKSKGYEPVLLIVRTDNLDAAITACRAGGWKIYMGDSTYDLIKNLTGFDIKLFLEKAAGTFPVSRQS